jgi:hypothetical protein
MHGLHGHPPLEMVQGVCEGFVVVLALLSSLVIVASAYCWPRCGATPRDGTEFAQMVPTPRPTAGCVSGLGVVAALLVICPSPLLSSALDPLRFNWYYQSLSWRQTIRGKPVLLSGVHRLVVRWSISTVTT